MIEIINQDELEKDFSINLSSWANKTCCDPYRSWTLEDLLDNNLYHCSNNGVHILKSGDGKIIFFRFHSSNEISDFLEIYRKLNSWEKALKVMLI